MVVSCICVDLLERVLCPVQFAMPWNQVDFKRGQSLHWSTDITDANAVIARDLQLLRNEG